MNGFKNRFREEGLLLGVGVLLGTGLGILFGIMVGNMPLGIISGIAFGVALDYVYVNMHDSEL